MRTAILAALLALVALPALGQEARTGAGRFAIGPSEDGFTRLDTVTGELFHCAMHDGAWRCDPLKAQGSALDDRFATLNRRLDALGDRVGALARRVSALEDTSAPREATPPANKPAMGLTEKALNRFLRFVRILKHGTAADAGT